MRYFNISSCAIILCFFVALTACNSKNIKTKQVCVTILPQKYIVDRIAGDYINTSVLIPDGSNPEIFDITVEQMKALYNSHICFTIGNFPFETSQLYPLLENHKETKIIKHIDYLKLIHGQCHHENEESHEHRTDPHVWTSPKNFKIMAKTVFDVLCKEYPEETEKFKIGFDSLICDVVYIDSLLTRTLSEKQGKAFIIYHPSLTYLAEEYGLKQYPIENEGKEPSPTYLAELIETIRKNNIKCIFIQSHFDTDNAKSISSQTGCSIFSINPLNYNWIDEMKSLNENLKNL